MTTCTYKIETAAGNGVVKAEMDLFNYAWGKYRKPIFLTKDFEQIFALLVRELKKIKGFTIESDLYLIELGTNEEIQLHGVVKWG